MKVKMVQIEGVFYLANYKNYYIAKLTSGDVIVLGTRMYIHLHQIIRLINQRSLKA